MKGKRISSMLSSDQILTYYTIYIYILIPCSFYVDNSMLLQTRYQHKKIKTKMCLSGEIHLPTPFLKNRISQRLGKNHSHLSHLDHIRVIVNVHLHVIPTHIYIHTHAYIHTYTCIHTDTYIYTHACVVHIQALCPVINSWKPLITSLIRTSFQALKRETMPWLGCHFKLIFLQHLVQ